MGEGERKISCKIVVGGETYPVTIYEAEEGGFWLTCTDLPGCSTQGDTLWKLFDNAEEVITGWLEAFEETLAVECGGTKKRGG